MRRLLATIALVGLATRAIPVAFAQTNSPSTATNSAQQLGTTSSGSLGNNGSVSSYNLPLNNPTTNNPLADNQRTTAPGSFSNSFGRSTGQSLSTSTPGISTGAGSAGASNSGVSPGFASTPMVCLDPQEMNLCLSQEGFTR
jgi:hypothetical protein